MARTVGIGRGVHADLADLVARVRAGTGVLTSLVVVGGLVVDVDEAATRQRQRADVAARVVVGPALLGDASLCSTAVRLMSGAERRLQIERSTW